MYTVLLFYKYVPIADPEALKAQVVAECERLGLLGRVLIAHEGINGTLEGTDDAARTFAAWITSLPEFADMQIKTSKGTGTAFPRLAVKVRKEIVGTRFGDEVDPTKRTGTYIAPEDLERWYQEGEDFVIVDMRNSYEYASGHFEGSVDAGLRDSRDLPRVLPNLEHLKSKKVLTVCTGGVRCEKMSAYLLHNGFESVYQLHGGMHTFMERYPGKRFKGTLYTFDGRTTMHFGGEREVVGECVYCKAKTEQYVNCSGATCREHYLACSDCVATDRTRLCLLCAGTHQSSPA